MCGATQTKAGAKSSKTHDEEYVPIEVYAVIGNCRTAALISREGSIDWHCANQLDAPAVFCRILDAQKGGYFSIHPADDFSSTRRYIGDTNVLETAHMCGDATVAVTDYMPVDLHDSTLVRVIEGSAGEMDLLIHFKPTLDHASTPAQFHEVDDGPIAGNNEFWLGLSSPGIELRKGDENTYEGRMHVRNGQRIVLRLVRGADPDATARKLREAATKDDLADTCAYWSTWADKCNYRGPYRSEVVRSALTLKLLTFEPTGAVVAAPTTSLPEWIGGVRNWDYRFTGLRDSSIILYALITLGYQDEAGDFLGWLKDVEGKHLHESPQIMYTIEGNKDIPERELEWLAGYRGSRPVRIGNAASNQCQLDIYGEVLTSAYMHFHHPGRHERANATNDVSALPTEDTWMMLRALVNDAARLW